MSEISDMLADSVERLFAGFPATGEAGQHWSSIEEMGIPDLLLPEEQGGMAASWQDAALVWHLIGAHAVALPVGETMIARRMLHDASLPIPSGPILLSTGEGDVGQDGLWSGKAWSLSPAMDGATLLVGLPNGAILVDSAHASSAGMSRNAAGEARGQFDFDAAPCTPVDGADLSAIRQLGALLRAAQIGGALSACLDLCRVYATDRSQFGRALKQFQAIQHQIALLAEEAAAVVSAAAAAACAKDQGDGCFEVACGQPGMRRERADRPSDPWCDRYHARIRPAALHKATVGLERRVRQRPILGRADRRTPAG